MQDIYKIISDMFVETYYDSDDIKTLSKDLLLKEPAEIISTCMDNEKLKSEMAENPFSTDLSKCVDYSKIKDYIAKKPGYQNINGCLVKFKPEVTSILPQIVSNNQEQKTGKGILSNDISTKKDSANKADNQIPRNKAYKEYDSKTAMMSAVNAEIAKGKIKAKDLKEMMFSIYGKTEEAVLKEIKARNIKDPNSIFNIMWHMEKNSPGITDKSISLIKEEENHEIDNDKKACA